jgi:hypothetical protein
MCEIIALDSRRRAPRDRLTPAELDAKLAEINRAVEENGLVTPIAQVMNPAVECQLARVKRDNFDLL